MVIVMKKSMFSLMLMDSVIKEIDNLAYEQETNRSNLINQILAEYVSIKTPEMHIKEIFDLMIPKMNMLSGFKVQVMPSDFMLAIKSPLEYKYRPTIKYSVELYRSNQTYIGELRVVFRTQHTALLSRLASFFEIWRQIETHYIQKHFPQSSIRYDLEEGRFKRTLMLPKTRITNEILSIAIGDYIKMFDEILKHYLYNSKVGIADIEKKYLEYLNNGLIII
jgi:hypothetical protein